MQQVISILIMLLIGFGFYFLLDSKLIEPNLRKLLNGPLNRLYIKYIIALTKRAFTMTAEPKPDIAWHIIAFTKVYQMGLPGISDEQRVQNLEYLKKVSLNSELLDELMEVLSKQTNRDFQIKLVGFIEDRLKKINEPEKTEHCYSEAQAFSPKTFIGDWSKAFSTWLTGALLSMYVLFSINSFSISSIVVIGILFSIFMSWPIIRLALSGFAKFSSVYTVIAIVFVALGLHAASYRTEVDQISADLTKLGYPVTMTIRYPLWLTADDIDDCAPGRSIAVQTEGPSAVRLEFRYDRSLLVAKDDSCHVGSPEFDRKNFEFYLIPSSQKDLFNEGALHILPVLINGNDRITLDNLTMRIQLEHPFWNFVYHTAIIIVPTGIGGFLLFELLFSKRKSE